MCKNELPYKFLTRIFCDPFIMHLLYLNYCRWVYLCAILLPLRYGLAAGAIGVIAIVSKFRFVHNIAAPHQKIVLVFFQ